MPATITDFAESEPPPPPTKCSKCLKFVRQVLSFLLSHIGLLSLVVGYCIMGAFIFEELEKENELQVKRNMTKNRLLVTDDLWEITRSMEVLRHENWTEEVTGRLRIFEKSLIIALKEKGWDGKESEETVTWTFAGGLFYSITVITTIGYGHIAPKTAIAKVVTIFYAILGIPLTVLCWSNIGDAMANAFRFCYWRICCYICTKKPKKKKKRHISRSTRSASVRYPQGRSRSIRRSIRTHRSADTYSDSLISYSISEQERFYDGAGHNNEVSTLQQNTSRPSKRSLPKPLHLQQPSTAAAGQQDLESQSGSKSETTPQSHDPPYPIGSAAHNAATAAATKDPNTVQEKIEKKPSTAARVARGLGLKRHDKETKTPPPPLVTNGGASSSVVGTEKAKPLSPQKTSTSAVTIPNNVQPPPPPPMMAAPPQSPTSIQAPSGISSYRLDRVPEDEWTIMDDYYDDYASEDEPEDFSTKPVPIWLSICLVIGYIVGGAFLFKEWEGWTMLDSSYFCFVTLTTIGFGDLVPDQKNTDGELRIALCSLYLLFGIAMIAMSFNLVQEQVINNVKGVAMQLGIIKDDDEDDE